MGFDLQVVYVVGFLERKVIGVGIVMYLKKKESKITHECNMWVVFISVKQVVDNQALVQLVCNSTLIIRMSKIYKRWVR